MSSQYSELRSTRGSIGGFEATQHILTGIGLGFVTAATVLNGSQPNFARCLAISWAATLYIHFRGLLPPNGIMVQVMKSCNFRSSSFSTEGGTDIPRAAITLGIGPYSSSIWSAWSKDYAMFNPHTKFEVSAITCYEYMKGDAKCVKCAALGRLGATQGHRHSIEHIGLLNLLYRTCTVFELQWVIYLSPQYYSWL